MFKYTRLCDLDGLVNVMGGAMLLLPSIWALRVLRQEPGALDAALGLGDSRP